MQDKKCTKCKAKFKWFRKKKTCADCGKPFCKNCTAKIENTRICVGLCLIRHACHLLVQLIIYYHSLLYRLSRRAEGFWRGHGNVSWVGDCNEPALLLMRRGFAIVVRDPTFIYLTPSCWWISDGVDLDYYIYCMPFNSLRVCLPRSVACSVMCWNCRNSGMRSVRWCWQKQYLTPMSILYCTI